MPRGRIPTTHVGSLPRPPGLAARLLAQSSDHAADCGIESVIAEAVHEIVGRQIAAGLDVINDGEMGRASYTHYVVGRLTGVSYGERDSRAGSQQPPRDMAEHPDVAAGAAGRGTARNLLAPLVCDGPVRHLDLGPLSSDIARLRDALPTDGQSTAFLTAASPATLAHFIRDRHYRDEDYFIADVADAMKVEYEAIYRAGLLLQIDCPDLAMVRHMRYQDLSEREFLKIAARNVEVLNHATAAIPREAMRLHVCWGNYPGPHTHDIPVARVVDVLARARPQTILFEAANPRHEHEWEDWQSARLPDDAILAPGVIDTTTNFVEHERLVAQRIERFIRIVGRERVMATTDCGFGTVAGRDVVAPSVVWAKLAALAAGANLAKG